MRSMLQGLFAENLTNKTAAAFCSELRDFLVVYYEKFCAMEAAGEEEPRSVPSPIQSGGSGRREGGGSERAGKPSG